MLWDQTSKAWGGVALLDTTITDPLFWHRPQFGFTLALV